MDTMPQPRKRPRIYSEEEITRVAQRLWIRVAVVCGTMFGCGFAVGAWLF